MSEETLVALGEDYPELRDSVRRICARYPGSYWSALEEKEAYPTEFVDELTQAGFLGALIPEDLRRLRPAAARRRGDFGGDQCLRLRRQPRSRADVHHGYAPETWQRSAKAQIPA